MRITCFDDGRRLAQAAADQAAAILNAAIARKGRARIVAATGASQFAFLDQLTRDLSIDWQRVEMFHLDEYIGLPADHPASFRRFLIDRLITPTGLTQHHLLDGEANPRDVCLQVGSVLLAAPVDVAFIGIGENGHLAFNDPPADFETTEPYVVVTLDEACRRQQVGEGWFDTLAEVPRNAISMSIRQILSANALICIVPDARKAPAVRAALEGEISPLVPASILRTHPDATIYLDRESAALLDERTSCQWS